MQVKKLPVIILFLLLSYNALSQSGGDNIYEFLNLTPSGKVTSLGGTNVSLNGSDINMSYYNPALLNLEMQKSLGLNYVNYFAGINYGLAMYSPRSGDKYSFAGGITYLNYGSFKEADASGLITGEFGASEYALSMICSRRIDSAFSIGINLKPVLSHLENYTSFGAAIDIGAAWHKGNTSAGLTLKNIGYQITTYTGDQREKLPFEIIAGLSRKLAYAPFRFSLTIRHLEKWDLTNYNSETAINGLGSASSPGFTDKLFRHLIPGIELIPHKNFYLSAGYNFQRRKELNVSGGSSAGLTWGFGVNTAWLDIEFGRAVYHLSGASNNISLVIRPGNIYHKNR